MSSKRETKAEWTTPVLEKTDMVVSTRGAILNEQQIEVCSGPFPDIDICVS
ncbi:MAG: hypothetical protein AAGE80_16520 [Pseudomonadota bacterium]